jgi:predicted nucleic acid-binding protein
VVSFLGRDIMLDAGPLVALLNQHDQWHDLVARAWPTLHNRFLTTEAVLTEATHLAKRAHGQPWPPLAFLLDAEIPILALHLPAHERCLSLMQKYEDQQMDYADASLVVIGDHTGVRRVLTLDRKGFETWRGGSGNRFEIVPLEP